MQTNMFNLRKDLMINLNYAVSISIVDVVRVHYSNFHVLVVMFGMKREDALLSDSFKGRNEAVDFGNKILEAMSATCSFE